MINQENSEMRTKPHLVVVCGVLYPNPSPTGLCSFRYASLLNDIFEIEYVALSLNGKQECVNYNGYKVHTLTSRRLSLEYRTSGHLKRLFHFVGTAMLKLSLLGNLGWYAKATYNKLEEINKTFPIDVVLTVCSPFSAHIAGMCFKKMHPNIRWCSYTVDPYADKHRVIPFFRKFQDFVQLEKRVLEQTDYLFLSEEAMSTRDDIYESIHKKVALPYLIPNIRTSNCKYFESKQIHCVYAGSFYRGIRNPEFMLRTFAKLQDENIVLHLYSSGCDDIVAAYKDISNIRIHGYVSLDELNDIYQSSDFMIGVGNAVHDFLPSKTYEYISLRKPIIFFNPTGFDNPVLTKYPHALQISDETILDDAVCRLKDFISSKKDESISEEELNLIFASNTEANIKNILLSGLM